MNLRTDLKCPLRRDVRLSLYTTMQVGGPASWFAEPQTEEELVEILDFAQQERLPKVILGKGSNLIFPDEGFPGLVISLTHYEQERIVVDREKSFVQVSAGVHLYRFVLAMRDAGLGGAEFLANIPGTIGGALVMNAGFSRFPGQINEIGDITEQVTILDGQGKRAVLQRNELKFSYRHSNLDGKIVLSAVLRLWRRPAEEIQREVKANFDYRNTKQDLRYPSSGSVFKNPGQANTTAGQLVEKAGLKGARVGGAMVSQRHGNYIVNVGGAKSSDVRQLISQIQKSVLDATGILLEPEVRFVERP